MLKPLFVAAACALPLAAPGAASAATVFETDPLAAGGFNVTAAPGSSFAGPSVDFLGTIFGGTGLVISGVENFSGTLASGADMISLSFEVYEPTSAARLEGCNTACVDSTFTLALFDDGSEVFSANFSPTDNTEQLVDFAGAPGLVFDSFTITEIVGTNDNEFFANFTAELAVIPLPAPALLLLAGLGGLGLVRRRAGSATG